MSIYTNEGLVRHAEAALAMNTKYMWGGILRPVTKACINLLRSIYGERNGTGYTAKRWEELTGLAGKGWYGCDCVGLIKSYYWSGKADGGTGSPNYGTPGFPDTNAGGMYNAAKVKGRIATLPETPGVIVYCRTYPHVGIYVGKGEVIECTLGARGDGVVKTKLSDFCWEYWFECPYISYVGSSSGSSRRPFFPIGCKVCIKPSAEYYSGTKIVIPEKYKNGSTFTVAKVIAGRVLLQELFSWVDVNDISFLTD